MTTICKVFGAFNISDISNTGPFTRADIVQNEVALKLSRILELRDIYLPCKAAIYLSEPISTSRCLTILRHMLRIVNATLDTTEQYMCGQKVVVYRIGTTGGCASVVRVSNEPRTMFVEDGNPPQIPVAISLHVRCNQSEAF